MSGSTGRPYGLHAYGTGPYSRWGVLTLHAAALRATSRLGATAEYLHVTEGVVCRTDWIVPPPCGTVWAPIKGTV